MLTQEAGKPSHWLHGWVWVLFYPLIGGLVGPHAVSRHQGSLEETTDLTQAVMATTASLVMLALLLVGPLMVASSVPMVGGAFALVGLPTLLLLIRNWRSRHWMRQHLTPFSAQPLEVAHG